MPLYEFNLNPQQGEDKIIDTTQQTAGYFPGGAGSIVGSTVFTASLADSNELYYFNISDDHPDSSSADVVFSVAYGHKGGSGSKLETSTKSESEAYIGIISFFVMSTICRLRLPVWLDNSA